ncbi:catalase family protein [Pseudomonas sp. CCI3.2]|uniref:catalase family protein n=1 Tax=unclassified Pseudomonas TaxID=196821 RepID=UPI002AC9A36F|nr:MULTISPECIES: catalase family protein [unclassified Pseudomonas]MEB0078150.1 catalase family protein [Pseudomonas sp. MH10out]MEB0093428.1 catalase family protein [Pseudomonas sp. CCI4.2]MEB0102204.1 catalase family protein [Pseudomonas sp. CCI3.2]MEB0132313.1 catalase family protein [Pseudomonas sp. CCI2.4]MEB0158957.1 catalase family protein [Pseudomonas sp. AH2 (2023)]
MLTTLWVRLGAFLGKTFLVLLTLGLVGWLLASTWFTWHYRGPVSAQEQVPPGESAMSQDIIQTAIRIVDQHRESTRYLRDAHAKAHGCVKAEVQVLSDLSPALRQGVFAEPGKTWQASMRLSNGNAFPQFDSIKDARGMAIKLMDVPGTQLVASQQGRDEQDFVMFSHPNFFVSDVAEYRQNIAAQANGQTGLAFFPSWDPSSWQIRHLFIALGTLAPAPDSPTQVTYYSVSPYKFGAANAKFRVAPDAQNCPDYRLPPQNETLPNFLRSALNQQLSTDRVPACFVLQIQRQDPSKFMPIEDTSIEWKESDAPFETVARVKIPAQDFDTPELNLACDNQSFSPWFGIAEHRPIGGINRLRKAVYDAVSEYRHARNAEQ